MPNPSLDQIAVLQAHVVELEQANAQLTALATMLRQTQQTYEEMLCAAVVDFGEKGHNGAYQLQLTREGLNVANKPFYLQPVVDQEKLLAVSQGGEPPAPIIRVDTDPKAVEALLIQAGQHGVVGGPGAGGNGQSGPLIV